MSDLAGRADAREPPPPLRPGVLWSLFRVALLLATARLFSGDWLRTFETSAPPVEELTFERTVLDGDGIHLLVRAGGSEPIPIAQVQVDGAYWQFRRTRRGSCPPGTAWLRLPYPWVLGETHEVKVLTSLGTAFKNQIEVARPHTAGRSRAPRGSVGLFVGVVPVVIGMLFYPALRGWGRSGLNFALALTVGLLLVPARRTRSRRRSSLRPRPPRPSTAASWSGWSPRAALLLLLAVGRRDGTPTGVALATSIALGIGLA